MDFSLIYITTKDKHEAQTIGRTLVQRRLAACANIFENMDSIYWWGDELMETGEAVLILKTRDDLTERVIAEVKMLHSYNCPDIVVLPIASGNPAYLHWMETETRHEQVQSN